MLRRLLPLLFIFCLSPLIAQEDSLKIEDVLNVPVESWSDTLRPQLRNLSSNGRVQWLSLLVEQSRSTFGKISPQHEKALDLIKGSYMATQRYQQTLGALNELLEIRTALYGKKSSEYADTYRFFGLFYRDTEDTDLAQYYYGEHERLTKELFGEESTEYINSLVGMAQYYQLVGELEKLESTMSKAIDLYEKVGAPKKGVYANLLQNMGIVYHDLNFLDKAKEYYLRAIDTLKAYNLAESYTYHYSSHLLGNIALARGQFAEAEKWYTEEMRIKEKTMGAENLNVQLSRLSNKVTLLTTQKRYAEAEPFMQEEVALTEKYYGTKQHSYYANAIVDAAHLYARLGEVAQATQYYEEALDIYYNTVGKLHLFTNNCHAQLAALQMEQGNIVAAEDLLQRILDYYNVRVENIYPTLSERERLEFARNLKQDISLIYTFATTQAASPEFIVAAADFNLFTKGLILENTLDAKMSAATGNDETLKALYKEWKKTKSAVSNNLIAAVDEVTALQIQTDSLILRANELEKQLAQRSLAFATQQHKRTSILDVQQKLEPGTAAIDMLSFHLYEDGITDSVLYYAFVTTPDREQPQLIPLTNEQQLKRILGVSAARYAQYAQIGFNLYENIWQPLEKALNATDKILISPSGLLHQISFAALTTNLEEETLLADQYEFAYFGNLKDVVEKEDTDAVERSIALFGGAQFDLDSTSMAAIARQRAGQENILIPSPFDDETELLVYADTGTRSFSEDSTRYALEFNYLPGTKQEVEYISKKFQAANWNTDVFTEEEALEDNVKNSSGPGAPGILHIATHGYFFAAPSEEQTAQMTLRERVATAANPLLRSGLAFTGVNHAWLGGHPVEGLDDGILTAYEISLLDFFSTDLVVLSACETGKGDILSGEGVFGLQRAFKGAGVENLIISLWKVPDAQTTELMQIFYDNYLGGDAIRIAFRKAQQQMRSQYPPYYWAGFILVE